MASDLSPIRTTLPQHATLSDVLSVLHDHMRLIKLNPNVISCENITFASDSPAQPSKWLFSEAETLHESLSGSQPPKYYSPVLKNPLWEGLPSFAFQAAMIDTQGGLHVVVEAPMGTKVWQRWSIERAGADDTDVDDDTEDGGDLNPGPWEVVERPKVKAWGFFTAFVKSNLQQEHQENHVRLRACFEQKL